MSDPPRRMRPATIVVLILAIAAVAMLAFRGEALLDAIRYRYVPAYERQPTPIYQSLLWKTGEGWSEVEEFKVGYVAFDRWTGDRHHARFWYLSNEQASDDVEWTGRTFRGRWWPADANLVGEYHGTVPDSIDDINVRQPQAGDPASPGMPAWLRRWSRTGPGASVEPR